MNSSEYRIEINAITIINKNVVELILENSNLWDHQYWDDVSLALLLKNLNIDPTEAKRFDITGNPYKQDIDLSNYHFRCRIDNHFGYPRFLEIYVLKHLYERYEENKEDLKVIEGLARIHGDDAAIWKRMAERACGRSKQRQTQI